MLDESNLDVDEDTSEIPDMGDGLCTVGGRLSVQKVEDAFDLSEGLLGVDQAILQSIDKCGMFPGTFEVYTICKIIIKNCSGVGM